VKKFLTVAWILLIPFQDSGLQALPIGFLGASPAFIPLALLLVILFVEWLRNDGALAVSRKFLMILGYIVIVTVVYLLISGTTSHGENLIIKSLNLMVLTALLILPIFVLDLGDRLIRHLVPAAFLITVAGVLLSDILRLEPFASSGILHYHENINMRPRGFTLESSWLSALTISLGLLSAHFAKSGTKKIVFLVLTAAIVLFSGSRGGIVALSFTVMLVLLFRMRMKTWFRLPGLVLIIVVAWLLHDLMTRLLASDILMYTSAATRLGLVVTSLMTVIHNPFGVGFSGFLPAIDKYGPMAIDWIDRTFGYSFKFTELMSYIGSDTDINISTKTFLFDYIFFFGIPFLILFILFNHKLIIKSELFRSPYLFAAVLFSFMAACTFIGGVGMYNLSLVYGIAFYEAYRKKDTGRQP
jgi:hypothetical protein